MTIQWRLRMARELAGLDQSGLAQATGIARSTISNYESGATTHMKPLYLRQIAMACGVDATWLQTGAAGPTPPDGLQTGYKSGRTGHLASMEDYVTAA